MKVFQNYANFYDTLYKDKNYEAECDFLESIFKKYARNPVNTILDLGCGTGGHALILAQRGYVVTGVDRSETMLAEARRKAAVTADRRPQTTDNASQLSSPAVSGRPTAVFHHGDIRTIDLGCTFDVVIAMFAVLGYQTSNEDVEAALRTARNHLNAGGLFIFDVWFGPAVLTEKPSDRIKVIESGKERIIRTVRPVMDVLNHTVEVNYKVIHISDKKVIGEADEAHRMRYFFPQEIAYFLEKNGFHLEKISPFMSLDGEVTANDWNVAVVAKAY